MGATVGSVTIGKKGVITIPANIRKILGVDTGDTIYIVINKKQVTIKKNIKDYEDFDLPE